LDDFRVLALTSAGAPSNVVGSGLLRGPRIVGFGFFAFSPLGFA